MVSKENKAFELKAKAGKIITVLQKLGVFQAFFQNAPRHMGEESMSWEEAVTMLILHDEKLKLTTEKKEGLFTVFFDVNKARSIKGHGFSQKTAVINLLEQSGVEIHVLYDVQKM